MAFFIVVTLVHLLFNVTGILIVYPVKRIRSIPVKMAVWMGNFATENRMYAFLYVICVFFVLPGLMILAFRAF